MLHGALARFAQDWDSDGDLNGEAWYPGAYASFAFWGGMLVSNRQPRASDRVVSHPSNFVPIKLRKRD